MGLGSLATAGIHKQRNLSIVVLDNERYGETGMQDSHTARGVNLAAVAMACGMDRSLVVTRMEEIPPLRERLYSMEGPWFAQIKVSADKLRLVLPPRDGTHLKNRFREALLGREAHHQK
jgi:thiamine pyrophosphate-dependent acetolactate synthase large subunit-like protein